MKTKTNKRVLQCLLLLGVFSVISLTLNAANAPITTVASVVNAVPGEQVTVPVTVSNFDSISGLTLSLDYDYSKLHFVSGSQNASLGGTCNIGDIDLKNGFHRLTISWFKFGSTGVSLPHGSSLVDYVFTFISGPASLSWYDIGPSCVYNDPAANTLNDIPASEYYFNGIVSDSAPEKPQIAASGPTSFFEGGSVTLTSSFGKGYLWSTGDTTSSIVVTVSGSYTVQTLETSGVKSEPSEPIVVTVISTGSIGLKLQLVNPRIVNNSNYNYFEFDVQVKADAEGTYLWNGQISLDFENTTLSSKKSDWFVTAGAPFKENNSLGHAKYGISFSTADSVLNIEYKGDASATNFSASEKDFVQITTEYMTLATIRGIIILKSGVAGIDFNESAMNGKQFYKLPTSPWFTTYAITNSYEQQDFMKTYVGRIYSSELWTQFSGLDWTKALNTSVWDGNASIPEENLSNASNLRIYETATLSVPANGKLTVSGNTEINIINGLIIQSDTTGTGSFITSTVTGAGSVDAQQYVATDAWYMLSSPLSGQSIASFLRANINVRTSADQAERHMTDFNPVNNDWNAWFTNTIEGNIETGNGYKVHIAGRSLVNFTGSLQAGDLLVNGSTGKWNCVGNLYTSYIRINSGTVNNADFLISNIDNLDSSYGAIYLWNQPDEGNGFTENYTAVSNASDPSEIQQGQAFFVKLNKEANNIQFTPGMQIHGSTLEVKSENNENPSIKLIASANATNAFTHIAFLSGMTEGLDATYDAGLLKGNSDLCIYSRLLEDNDESFAIQALPNNINSDMIIPIGLDFKTGGEVVFSAELLNIPASWRVTLEDQLDGTFTELSEKDYVTQIEANSNNNERFKLHTSYIPTGLNYTNLDGHFSAYTIGNSRLIVKGDVTSVAVAKLYDMQGRILLTNKLNSGSYNEVNLSGLKSGVYILNVYDIRKTQSIKIVITE